MNEISFGNDEIFKGKIKEVDAKLLKLLNEINTGVDGGDKTLFETIGIVLEEIKQIEKLANEVDIESGAAGKNVQATANNLDNTREVFRQIQDELSKLLNATTVEGPEALQDAFDRSEKFNSNSSQLTKILEEVKLILKDFEANLRNAKTLTTLAIEKFANVSSQADEATTLQKEVDHELKEIDDMKISDDELRNLKKLVKDAVEKTKQVYVDAFDLLNEVTKFDLNNRLNEINDKVGKLNNHSDATTMNLKNFADENAKFLADMETTIDASAVAEEKAFKLQNEIEELLKTIKSIHEDAIKSITDKDSIVENARKIRDQLEDFTLKVEKSRENARAALEKIPEILKKIEDSVKIVDKLEKKLDNDTRAATETKEKCSTAKEQMDEILGESDDIRAKIKQLETDFESLPADIKSVDKEATRISDEIDKLEKTEADDNKLIELAKIKIETTKSQAHATDVKVDDALEKIQSLMDRIAQVKNIDQESLNDFGKEQILKNNYL